MHTIVRARLVPLVQAPLVLTPLVLLAGLNACSSPAQWTADPALSAVQRIDTPAFTPPSPTAPAPVGLDDYKTLVARHVAEHNPDRAYHGTLPPLLPAVVVLRITVDRDGQLADVVVQRSRNAGASEVALASVRRSTPLPRPLQLAQASGQVTFLETFLFADSERYQLRSLAGPQASE